MIVAAIDFGRKRIGVAVSGPGGMVLPVDVLTRQSETADYDWLRRRLSELGVERVIVGWPLNMDGSAGPQAQVTEGFVQKLRLSTGLPVELYDERLTSFEARSRREPLSRGRKSRPLDALAACVLLESWLQAQAK